MLSAGPAGLLQLSMCVLQSSQRKSLCRSGNLLVVESNEQESLESPFPS